MNRSIKLCLIAIIASTTSIYDHKLLWFEHQQRVMPNVLVVVDALSATGPERRTDSALGSIATTTNQRLSSTG